MTGTGERYGIVPSDWELARSENRPPRRDLIRDSLEVAELRDGAEVPFLIDPHPALAARLRAFVAWLEEETR